MTWYDTARHNTARNDTSSHITTRSNTNRHEPTKKKLSVHLKNHYFDFLCIFTPSRLFRLKNFRSSYKNLTLR